MENSISSTVVRLMFQAVLLPMVVVMVPLAFVVSWLREALVDLTQLRW